MNIKKPLLVISIVVLLSTVLIPASWLGNKVTSAYSMFSYGTAERWWWNGRVKNASMVLRGYRVFIGDLHWQYEWLSIFSGIPCAQFYSHDALMQTEGYVCYSLLDNTIIVRDSHFLLSADEVAAVSGAEIIGHIDGYVEEVVVRDNSLALIQGNIVWNDAQWHNGEKWLSLGQILFAVTTDDNNIVVHSRDVSSRDVNSPVMIDLTMLFQQQYIQSVTGSVSVNDTTDPSLRDTLHFLADKKQGQQYFVKYFFD